MVRQAVAESRQELQQLRETVRTLRTEVERVRDSETRQREAEAAQFRDQVRQLQETILELRRRLEVATYMHQDKVGELERLQSSERRNLQDTVSFLRGRLARFVAVSTPRGRS
jgi:predicted  nucleic acid-binding Zn-ribbon protein